MKSVVILLLIFLSSSLCTEPKTDGDTWVVLLAGSNTYQNYRHQADVCQAYHQIHDAGVPDERIIVWMYDDIAHNVKNPWKGKIINYKGGPNVYKDTPKDYTKDEVVPANFMKFLKGENMTIGSGKSLKSGENDRVFIYFTDHGGPGIICFPGFIEFHVKDLMDTLQYMFDNKMYKELVFYMEACESGSMFDGYEVEKMNIYAVTASNPFQSSYACDYDAWFLAYLNDCWSKFFLADTRETMKKGKMNTKTFEEQFDDVKKKSKQSPECRYGDLDIAKNTLDYFQGEPSSMIKDSDIHQQLAGDEEKVSSYDVPFYLIKKNLEFAKTDKERKMLTEELEKMEKQLNFYEKRWNYFAEIMNIPTVRSNDDRCNKNSTVDTGVWSCMKTAVEIAKGYCGNFDELSRRYYFYIYNSCLYKKTILDIDSALKLTCSVY